MELNKENFGKVIRPASLIAATGVLTLGALEVMGSDDEKTAAAVVVDGQGVQLDAALQDPFMVGEKPCGPVYSEQEIREQFEADPNNPVAKPSEVVAHFDANPQVEASMTEFYAQSYSPEMLNWINTNIPQVEELGEDSSSIRGVYERLQAKSLDEAIVVNNHQCDPETGEVFSVGQTVLQENDLVWGVAMNQDQYNRFLDDLNLENDNVLTTDFTDAEGAQGILVILQRARCNNPLNVVSSPPDMPTTTFIIETSTSTTPDTTPETTSTIPWKNPENTPASVVTPVTPEEDRSGKVEQESPVENTGGFENEAEGGVTEVTTPTTVAKPETQDDDEPVPESPTITAPGSE